MKKILFAILIGTIVVISPALYVMSTFVFKGAIADEEFQKNLATIVKQLEVKVEGEGDETLVFIHGYPDSLEMWDKQAEFFKTHYQVARFTLPGFELTDNGARPHYNIKQMRLIIDSYIKSLNSDSVTVIAHDWGAVYASHYLKKNSLVDKLVLLDVGSFGDEQRPSINVKYTFALAVAWTLPEFLGTKLALYTADSILHVQDVDPNKSINDLRPDARMTYPYWHLWKDVLTKDSTIAVKVKDYGTPFLFIYGQDKKVWFHAKSWEKEIQDLNKGQVESVPGGHWFMQSSPDLVNQKLATWFVGG